MCGLSLYSADQNRSEALGRSLEAIAHRGPDARGQAEWRRPDGGSVGFGHVRLSIVDTSAAGNQPMISADGRIAMIFNGEIYNHADLAGRLPDHVFKSSSDSEVLLELYAKFGSACFADLCGMFSAAFLDIATGAMVIVRDQIGIKPVYYATDSAGLYVSSEIKGLTPFLGAPPAVSLDGLFEFLNCGFVFEPESGLEGIRKIPAGCYLQFDRGKLSVHRYFSLDEATRLPGSAEAELMPAVRRQLIADVKLGVFFSGGLDSSIIAAGAKREALFAAYDAAEIESGGLVDDAPYAEQIARILDIDLTKVAISDSLDPDYILDTMRTVAVGSEEMISDYTYYASLQLSQAARANGFKVMLSGTGGDEAFIGYPRYKLVMNEARYRPINWLLKSSVFRSIAQRNRGLAKKVDRFTEYFGERHFALRYARLVGYLSRREITSLMASENYDRLAQRFVDRCDTLLQGFEGDTPLMQALVLDYHGYLSHNLSVADKSSMSVGLELRVPLLDPAVYCGSLGALRQKDAKPRFGKQVLRDALLKILPKHLVDRRKAPFNPPLDAKIAALGQERIERHLSQSPLGQYLDLGAAKEIVSRHFQGLENNTYKVWQLLYLSFWLEGRVAAADGAGAFSGPAFDRVA